MIYLFTKGQFWPRSEMISFGQPESLTVSVSGIKGYDDLEIHFSVKEKIHLNTHEHPCIEDIHYSLTECLHEYAFKQSNCKLNNFGSLKEGKRFCTKEGFESFIETLQYLKQEDIEDIKTVSGCISKCKNTEYSYEKNLQKVLWETNNRSEVFIQAKTSVVSYMKEYYTFDLNDLISSVGGNLGLFLGWSILTVVGPLGSILIFIINKCKIRFNKSNM